MPRGGFSGGWGAGRGSAGGAQRGALPSIARGALTPEQAAFRRAGKDRCPADLSDPGAFAPEVYDRTLHPRSAAWFKESAVEMIERVAGYLEILDAHGVAWELVRGTDPGTILYEDVHQVIPEPTRGLGLPSVDNETGGRTGGESSTVGAC